MADAIPVADPGLLAAQAKAGQAGVDAYNAAISTLQAQKQQAVQGAMQEAAMRGSPQGAAESQSGIISTPYDQRIASLTQNLGGYQASQAARTGRMNDYNQAVLAARSYIPQQVELAVAPIRAQADFNVRNTQMEGEQRVAGIDAERELTLAKMQAAFQAAQIAAAKAAAKDAAGKKAKAQTLNQGELSALMGSGAAGILNQTAKISDVLAANAADLKKQTLAQAATARTAADATIAGGRNQSYWDLLGARYTGKAVEEEKAKQTAAPRVPLPMQVPASAQTSVTGAGFPGIQDVQGGAAQLFQVPGVAPATAGAGAAASAAAMFAQINQRARSQAASRAGEAQISQLAQHAAAAPGLARQQATGKYLQDVVGAFGQELGKRTTFDPTTGRQMFLTPEQQKYIAAGDPFGYNVLAQAPRSLFGSEDFGETVWGAPSEANQGFGGRYSSDVMRAALGKSAENIGLAGYSIDAAQVANAMPAKGSSVYDFLAGQEGAPDAETVYRQSVAAGAATDKTQVAQDKADAKDWLRSQGLSQKVPSSIGDEVDVVNMINDPQIGPVIADQRARVADLLANWNARVTADETNVSALDAKGRALPPTRDRVREIIRRWGDVPDELVDVLLYMNGLG